MSVDSLKSDLTSDRGVVVERHAQQRLLELRWWHVSMPLRTPIAHASAHESTVDSVIVAADLDGLVGFAEVRANGAYATGETGSDIDAALRATRVGDTVGEVTRRLLPVSKLASMAIDIAAWDALGKRMSAPLYQLLGGSSSRRLLTHAQIGFGSIDEARSLALDFVASGFSRLKVRIGGPDSEHDMRRLQAIREAVGRDTGIIVDANAGMQIERAQGILPSLADVGVEWFEQPVATPADLAQLTAARIVPIYADESARDARTIEELISLRAVDGVHLKLEKAGTVARLIEAVATAHTGGLDVALGQMDQGRLGSAATAHVALGLGLHKAETWGFANIVDDIAWNFSVRRGRAVVSEGAGLGIKVSLPEKESGNLCQYSF